MAWGKKQFSDSVKTNFSKVPNSLLSLSNLKPLDKLVFIYIYSLNEEFHPTVRKISSALNTNKDSINKSLQRLEQEGLIKRHLAVMKSETSIMQIENWVVPERKTCPKNTDNTIPQNQTGQSLKEGPIKYLKDLFTRAYPKREGLQDGLRSIERMKLNQETALGIEAAFKNYNAYIKKQNIDERYRLSLSKFLIEWPSYTEKKSKKKQISWGNPIEDGGTT